MSTASRRSSSSNSQTTGYILGQVLLGVGAFGLWALVINFTANDNVMEAGIKAIPFLAFYILGVLSRYVPGVKEFAKKIK